MADDHFAATRTEGTVAVGGTASGNIETGGDRDWFAVELVAGRFYTIDLRGRPTDDGTLSDPYLRGIHDAEGNLVAGTVNDDWGGTYNSQATFTASASGTYYIAAGAWGNNRGTYEVEVTDTSPAGTASPPDPAPAPADADATRAGATDLGDITTLQGPRFPQATLDGEADRVDYYRFTLTEAKRVGLGLRQQDADADLYLEDADGNVLYRSTTAGTGNERIAETLLAGTYYMRVESQEAGVNAHVVRYGVSAPDPDALAALEQAAGAAANEAPEPPAAGGDETAPPSVSEPEGEDFSADTATSGRVAVGETATGDIATTGDRDWFAVELVAGGATPSSSAAARPATAPSATRTCAASTKRTAASSRTRGTTTGATASTAS